MLNKHECVLYNFALEEIYNQVYLKPSYIMLTHTKSSDLALAMNS